MKELILFLFISSAWAIRVYHDPMMNKDLFEGDIMGIDFNADRNAVPLDSRKWPSGIIPYIVSPELSSLTPTIKAAMKHIQDRTCIRFVKRSRQRDYVKILKGDGCSSYWGKIGKEQVLSLGKGCERFGTIVHELIHAIGFDHEHNRSDRDQYLDIHWENIDPGEHRQFTKLRPEQNRLFTTFDYGSIMLYGSNYFAIEEGLNSMTGKGGKYLTPQRDGMSPKDAKRINLLYEC